MFFSNDWLDELIARCDIVQMVSSYLPLKRSGRNYLGLCPFHKEKTPSFNVNGEKQFYHCFGCKASGSVIHFVMAMENLSFQEACEYLAKLVNLPLPEQNFDPEYQKRKSLKERIALANKEAAKIYHKQLWEASGKAVLNYFRERGLSDKVIIKFGLGASGFGDVIKDSLLEQGFLEEELIEAGLVINRKGKSVDVFKNRAMFPIVGVYGEVLGFGGRALGDAMPKYLNTSDTPLFNKRKTVYAANLLRKERNLKRILLVEGYMDVIALDQYDIQGAVATLGTALTPEQARLLSRYAREVHICYDGDSAGQNASERAIGIIEEADCKLHPRILQIPDKKDPDEFVRAYGKEAFDQLKPLHSKLFQIERLKTNYQLDDEYQKTEFDSQSARILAQIPSAIELNNILDRACSIIGINKELLLEEIHKLRPEVTKALLDKELRKEKQQQRFSGDKKGIPEEEKIIVSIMAMGRLPFDLVEESIFRNETAKQVYLELKSGKRIPQILDNFDTDSLRAVISDTLMRDYSDHVQEELMKMVQDCMAKMKKNALIERKQYLQANFDAMSETDKEQATQEILQLNKQIRTM